MLSNWNITLDHVHVFFCETMQKTLKALLLVQDVDTRWNSTYLMLKRLKKLKLGVWYYVAISKNNQDSIITFKKWQLVNHNIQLLEPFFFVTKE